MPVPVIFTRGQALTIDRHVMYSQPGQAEGDTGGEIAGVFCPDSVTVIAK